MCSRMDSCEAAARTAAAAPSSSQSDAHQVADIPMLAQDDPEDADLRAALELSMSLLSNTPSEAAASIAQTAAESPVAVAESVAVQSFCLPPWTHRIVQDNAVYLKHLERRTSTFLSEFYSGCLLADHDSPVLPSSTPASVLPAAVWFRCSFCADPVPDASGLAAHEATCPYAACRVRVCERCGAATRSRCLCE